MSCTNYIDRLAISPSPPRRIPHIACDDHRTLAKAHFLVSHIISIPLNDFILVFKVLKIHRVNVACALVNAVNQANTLGAV